MHAMTKEGIWFKHSNEVLDRIRKHVPPESVGKLQKLKPWRHFLTTARMYLQLFLLGYIAWVSDNPLIWLPAAALQGVTVLGFIILLHEQLHNAIFSRPHPRASRILGYLYAFPSAISPTQFTRWHLDHHANLGSEIDDPKRAHLSPKRNARWYKLLYFTFGLVFIYAKAASAENKTYTEDLRRKIRKERTVNILLHLIIAATIAGTGGFAVLLRVHLVPLLVFFPMAFIINRMGQHYWIDPADPAKWGTRVDGNALIHFLFLWSNFHMEHHYYPKVPMYNLRKLNRLLQPFFQEIGMENRTYTRLLYGWLILNQPPHTQWTLAD